ncbi:flavin-containing monooxygenase [Nocardia terpenica]|uniref:NAD(P)-binding protein n=1 Tax=Nocardia terpenica TaxID=455432 RepID=A0A6G9ZDV0_9NOCA|nr:NAD(P)/FAD-dependent oxidoreductase [Nocardia terpenica]QIS23624.1 NAD(P)-binding protein [Nocardia terpenica]
MTTSEPDTISGPASAPAGADHPPLAVAIIGAGFGGLGMAVALQRAGITNYEIYEEADTPGGVWRDNTYPDCACDVPSHLYSYSFAPYRDPRRRYPGQAQILDYLQHVARDHQLFAHLRLRTPITTATYLDEHACWELTTGAGDRVRAEVIVFAVGQLHRPHLPDIPGRNRFEGTAMHTAAWDHTQDLRGRSVAVIGTGSSAAQLIPTIASQARTVTVFQRTPHWVLPKPAPDFGPLSRLMLRLPGGHRLYRRALLAGADLVLAPVMRRGWSARGTEVLAKVYLRHSIPDDPVLRAAVTPDYPIGTKRIIIDSGYYPALRRDNVALVTDPIEEITATGIQTIDGAHHDADVIIYATGFRAAQFLAPIRVYGRDGRSLQQQWAFGAHAFLGLAVPGCPNAFFLAGPNTFTPAGSNPAMKEHQAAYILACLRWRRSVGAAAIEVDSQAMRCYQQWLDTAIGDTVWPDSMSIPNWYRHPSGQITSPWPGSVRGYARMLRQHPPARTFRAVAPQPAHPTADGS